MKQDAVLVRALKALVRAHFSISLSKRLPQGGIFEKSNAHGILMCHFDGEIPSDLKDHQSKRERERERVSNENCIHLSSDPNGKGKTQNIRMFLGFIFIFGLEILLQQGFGENPSLSFANWRDFNKWAKRSILKKEAHQLIKPPIRPMMVQEDGFQGNPVFWGAFLRCLPQMFPRLGKN